MTRFCCATMTTRPRKKPTENEVGNRLRMNVPRMAMVNWMMAVHTDATLSASDPSPLSRVATGGHRKGMETKKRKLGVSTTHWNKIVVQHVPEIMFADKKIQQVQPGYGTTTIHHLRNIQRIENHHHDATTLV